MKSNFISLISLLIALSFAISVNAQSDLVITEINYNPAESGQDSTEFIEFYNKGAVAIDLTGYTFSSGVTGNLPSVSLAPGAYLVMCVDSMAMIATFNVNAYPWTSGGLSNGGEPIAVRNASNVTVDSLRYDDVAPWPLEPDGDGATLVLCDPTLDNTIGSNWSACTVATGLTVNGKAVKAHPGAGCSAVVVDVTPPTVSWVGAINDTIIKVKFNEVVDTTSAELMTNYSIKSGIAIQSVTLIHADSVKIELSASLTLNANDTLVVSNIADTAMNAMTAAIENKFYYGTVAPTPGIPSYSIGLVSATDVDGVADSINVECKITGVVMAASLSATSLQITIHDGTDGIGVYKGGNFTVPYTAVVGDEIRLIGTIGQFNGLTQMSPDSFALISQGNPVMTPAVTTTLSEANESDLVRIDNVTLSASAVWPTTAGSAVNIDVTDGTNTYAVRIDETCTLQGTVAPVGSFSIIGIVGQYDSSSPYTSGYQIFPRTTADLIQVTTFSVNNVVVSSSNVLQVSFNEDIDTTSAEMVSNYSMKSGLAITSVQMLAAQAVQITLSANLPSGIADTLVINNVGNDAETDTVKNASFQVVYGVVTPPTIPTYTIGQISSVDVNGVADSLGVECKVVGVVHGINYKSTGLQFVMHDGTDGVWTYSPTNVMPAYTVTEGDEIRLIGEVGQYNGLVQMYVDSIVIVQYAQTLQTPTVVTSITEADEAELVKLENLTLVTPSDWPTTAGSSANVEVTNGTDNFSLRIVADCNIQGTAAPTSTFKIIGLVGQFDSSSPYDGGYQVFPRTINDLDASVSISDIEFSFNVYPNPTQGSFVVENENAKHITIRVMDLSGRLLLEQTSTQDKVQVNLDNVVSGMYILWIKDVDSDALHMQKLIVE